MPVPVLDNQLQISDFKGLNTSKPSDLIADEEFPILTNLVNHKGIIKKRPGIELVREWVYSETPAPPASYGELAFIGIEKETDNVGIFYFYDITTGKIYATDDIVNGTLVLRSGAAPVGISSLIMSPGFPGFGPFFYGSVGAVEGLFAIVPWGTPAANPVSGVGLSLGNEGILFLHQDRLWTFSDKLIYFSEPGNPATTSPLGANTITVESLILDIVPLQDKLIILTNIGIYVLNIQGAPRNWSLTLLYRINNKFHNIPAGYRHRYMIVFDASVYIITSDGLLKTNGVEVVNVSEPVKSSFNHLFSNFFTCAISIFNLQNKELLVKLIGDLGADYNNQILYYIYNDELQVWTKLETSLLSPADTPLEITLEVPVPLTYNFDSFYHLDHTFAMPPYSGVPVEWDDAIEAYNAGQALQGLYFSSNALTSHWNRLYHIPEDERFWTYLDGDTGYTSVLQTKTFDLGYRGANKKCNKQYISVNVTDPDGVDLSFTHIVNDTEMTPIERIVTPNQRMIKHPGPGYFQEYAMKIQDDPDGLVGKWELETIALDIINKAEQLQDTGK